MKTETGKTATEILFEHGIDVLSLNDDFNSQLFSAMERYAEQFAPTEQAAEQDRWIPVSEPPKENGFYIVWCERPEEYGLVYYNSKSGWQNGFYNYRVTHYQKPTKPLPPAPTAPDKTQ